MLKEEQEEKDESLDVNKHIVSSLRQAVSLIFIQILISLYALWKPPFSEALMEKLDELIESVSPKKGKVAPFSVTSTETIITPENGKMVRILGFFYCVTTDIETELRFQDSGNLIAGLPNKGVAGMNLTDIEKPKGQKSEKVEIYLSTTGQVKGWVSYQEV